MTDKSVPFTGVIMTCDHPNTYPRCPLPNGYVLRPYEAGMEQEWAELQVDVGQMPSIEAALTYFERDFAPDLNTLRSRGAFVYSPNGKLAASGILWYGSHLGRERARIRKVAVASEEQGKGLCKALMTVLMDMYHEQNLNGGIYLTSQTQSYKAINIYHNFGFKPYIGPQPSGWRTTTDDFEQETCKAWNLIEQKLRTYREQL